MSTQQMSQKQAVDLFLSMRQGAELGSDADGNSVRGETRAGVLLDFMAVPNPYFARERNEPGQWVAAESAAFLRQWADALEQKP